MASTGASLPEAPGCPSATCERGSDARNSYDVGIEMASPSPMSTTQDTARREFLLKPHPVSVGEARKDVLELAEPLVDERRLGDLL